MPQETNLNVSPYFDDFDPRNEYYKVLFKPGYPIQARELTTLQSILQGQIEKFGNHVFKEGSVVIPGNIIYKNDLNSVILEDTYQGLPTNLYLDSLIGTKIRGSKSGITAEIQDYLDISGDIKRITLIVKYLSSDSQTNSSKSFIDGEILLADEDVTVIDRTTLENENITEILLQRGQGFAATVSQNSTYKASAVYLEEGVYYIRGYFVDVPTCVLYLDPYSNIPSAKVGLRIFEEIRTAFDNEDLYDNAQGFSNYAAPGADRFSIFTKLEKIPLDSTDTNNFIQLLEINQGNLINISNTSQYNILSQEFARRTFDESGDYYVDAPIIKAQETLNNFKGNNGIFNEGQLTYNNNPSSEGLGAYNISPFKAYIRGYEIETISPTFLDFPKPRETKTLENQSINYFTGPTFTLNRVYGSPIVSIATTYYVSLRDSRVGISSTTAPGQEIGLARVYDFALESGSYSASNPNENQWDISLYDIQTYTTLTLNEPITLSTPVHVKGKESGAVGFLRYDVSAGVAITVYNSQGKFSLGEKLIFDGIENNRVTKQIRSYGTSDIKSIYGIVGTAYTFTGDTVQSVGLNFGQVTITANSSGISTVTSSDKFFAGIATVGNLVAFSNPGLSVDTFAKIESVSEKSLTISGITTVSGICDGALPSTIINPSNFTILTTKLQRSEDNSLYTILPKSYISNVDLSKSNLIIRKQFDVTISSNSTGVINAGGGEVFLPYDEERYVLIGKNGATELLSSDKFLFTNGSSSLTINGLSNDGDAKLIATLRKTDVKAKIKNNNSVKTLIIDKSKYSASGIGSTTLNDGLEFGKYPYGTRVQDEEICLLEPDVTNVYGIFESNDLNNPDLPSVVLSSLNGPTNKTSDLLLGEEFIGEKSKSIGIYSEKINDSKIGFVYLNSNNFIEGEKITFSNSKITAFISTLDAGDKNIASSFNLDRNQKETIYDYSKLNRLPNTKEPTKKLKIVFGSASFSASDTGDLTTVNSYGQFDYLDIGYTYDYAVKNSDILDIRPRVSNTSISSLNNSKYSPFEFLSRNFIQSGNSSSNILASDESITLTYSFYLPRIDKIAVDKSGVFQLKSGVPSEEPQPPIIGEDALEIATAYLPAYLEDINDIDINLKEHKRYRMSDITLLENRIENLEYYTSLSLLEVNASNFQVTDENGINRFKSGFFVDNFTSKTTQNSQISNKNSIDIDNREIRPSHFSTSVDLLLGTNSLVGLGASANPLADSRTDDNLIGIGVTRTGQLVTLNYTEVPYIIQPYSSRSVNVNPYAEDFYSGTITLFPSSDVWVDPVRNTANNIFIEREETELAQLLKYDQQKGFAGATWNSVEKYWIIPEKRSSLGDKILDTKVIPYMRSRNLEFISKRMKPLTRVYSFFGGIDISRYIIPKLLEIQMLSGVFEVGETVEGFVLSAGISPSPIIKFRVAAQNHKYGDYRTPSDIYLSNPYNPSNVIPALYSSTSTILNVDTFSLSNQPQGNFSGYIVTGLVLRGQTSKAEATITNIRLLTDETGVVIGSFFIPNPNLDVNPKFECGSKSFRLTSSSTNSLIYGTYSTSAEEKYFSEGKINTVQENVLVSRPIRIETPEGEFIVPGPGTPPVEPPRENPIPPSRDGVPSGGAGVSSSGGSRPTTTTSTQQLPTQAPIIVDPTPPPQVSTPTKVYYNFGTPRLYENGEKRLKELAKAADIPKDLRNLISTDMTAKQEKRIVNAINNSSYADANNIKVQTSNIKGSDRVDFPSVGVPIGVQGKTSKTGPGISGTNSNNNSSSKQEPSSTSKSSSPSTGIFSPAPASAAKSQPKPANSSSSTSIWGYSDGSYKNSGDGNKNKNDDKGNKNSSSKKK